MEWRNRLQKIVDISTQFGDLMAIQQKLDNLATPPEQDPFVRLHDDAEFYDARVSDVLVWETADQAAYRAIVEGLRETPFWDHYFHIVDIIPAIENAYADHYDAKLIGAAA